MDLLVIHGFRWFWGLTCDLWAENEEKKITATTKAIESVALLAALLLLS
jgi:hypothetical protein